MSILNSTVIYLSLVGLINYLSIPSYANEDFNTETSISNNLEEVSLNDSSNNESTENTNIPPTNAENKPKEYSPLDKKWEFKITPYGVLSDFNGNATLDGYQSPNLKAKFSDIIDFVDFTASGRAELWHNKWGLIFDGYYVDLGQEVNTKINIPPGTFIKGRTVTIPAGRFRPGRSFVIPPGPGLNLDGPGIKLDTKMGFYDFAASYRYALRGPSLIKGKSVFIEPLLGLRVASIKQQVDFTPGTLGKRFGVSGRSPSRNITYIEPFIGTNVSYRLSKYLSTSIRGDIGGCGIGNASHLTWNMVSTLGIHLNEKIILNLGYAIKDINYSSGSGRREFGLDGMMKGPWLGLTFKL